MVHTQMHIGWLKYYNGIMKTVMFAFVMELIEKVQTVKETIGVGVNEKAALSSDKNCPFVYINFDFTLVNKVASL